MTETITVKIKLLDPDAKEPAKMYPGDVAADLCSRVNETIHPQEFKGIPTGIAIELPRGYEAQIRPRSGLALKYGISIVNTPGTIDTEYRGEIIVILINHGKENFKINKGDRICQMAIRRVPDIQFKIEMSLTDTIRGEKGFGSSGK